ncbi:MAG: DUF4177 domain-containing protein [Paracoccaceae bacterium]
MRNFEYKAIPAPHQGTKAKGVKSTEDRFALSMTDQLNEMAAEGWEYVRAETLPCDERKGLTGTQTVYQNVLIFRRLEAGAEPLALQAAPTPSAVPVEDDFEQTQHDPAPRPVTLDDAHTNSAPPLGSARGD